MCKLKGYYLGQSQRRITRLAVDYHSYRMRQDLAQHSVHQMPHISRPHPLDLEPFGQLAEDRLNPIPPVVDPTGSLRLLIATAAAKRGQQLHALLTQTSPQFRLPIIPIRQTISAGLLNQRLNQRLVGNISPHHRHARDNARPTHPHMEAKSIKDLLDAMILAVVGLTTTAFAFGRAGTAANRHRERIENSQLRVGIGAGKQVLPERFFNLPEVGRLAHKARAMERQQGRKEMAEVAAEVVEDSRILM